MNKHETVESRVSFQSDKRLGLHAVSSGPQWLGLRMEVGMADGWDGDHLMVKGHLLAMNTSTQSLHLQIRDQHQTTWTPHVRAPGSFWIRPEGQPFSLRHHGESQWAIAIIDRQFFRSVLGGHYSLRADINAIDPVLEHLFRSLIEELLNPSPQPEVTQSLVRSVVITLGVRHGSKLVTRPDAARLSQPQLHALQHWLDGHLDKHITVAAMAAQVGLSTTRFFRDFKNATGQRPWEFVVELRLQRACRLLQQGESACVTALLCGFFDQAHLSRLFKQRFGLSPSAYAREASEQQLS